MYRSRMTIFLVSPILQDKRQFDIVLSRTRHLNGRVNFKLIILYNSENLFSLDGNRNHRSGLVALIIRVHRSGGKNDWHSCKIPRTAIYISIPSEILLEFASILFHKIKRKSNIITIDRSDFKYCSKRITKFERVLNFIWI